MHHFTMAEHVFSSRDYFAYRFEPGEQHRGTDAVDGQAIRRFDAEIRVGRRRRAGRLSATRPAAFVVGHHGGDTAVASPADDVATTATTRIAAEEFRGDGRGQFTGKLSVVHIMFTSYGSTTTTNVTVL